MNVRRATPADAPAIAQIHVASWQSAYRGLFPDAVLDGLSVAERTSLWQPRLDAAETTIWVSEQDGRITGFIYSCPSRDADAPSPQFAEIAALYIHPDAWGTGHGRALCEHVFAELRGSAAQSVIVWALAGNREARHFYEHLGFAQDDGHRDLTRFNITLPEVRFRHNLR